MPPGRKPGRPTSSVTAVYRRRNRFTTRLGRRQHIISNRRAGLEVLGERRYRGKNRATKRRAKKFASVGDLGPSSTRDEQSLNKSPCSESIRAAQRRRCEELRPWAILPERKVCCLSLIISGRAQPPDAARRAMTRNCSSCSSYGCRRYRSTPRRPRQPCLAWRPPGRLVVHTMPVQPQGRETVTHHYRSSGDSGILTGMLASDPGLRLTEDRDTDLPTAGLTPPVQP